MCTTNRPPSKSSRALRERQCPVEAVEVEDALSPFRTQHSRCFLGAGRHARGDDQVVVRQGPAAHQRDSSGGGVDDVNLADDEVDPVGQKGMPRPGDLIRRVGTEREEQVPGLIVVRIVLVDDRDLPLRGSQGAPQFVHDHRSGGTSAQHQESLHDNISSVGRQWPVSGGWQHQLPWPAPVSSVPQPLRRGRSRCPPARSACCAPCSATPPPGTRRAVRPADQPAE